MPFSKDNIGHTLNGILFVGFFAMAAMRISNLPLIAGLTVSTVMLASNIISQL